MEAGFMAPAHVSVSTRRLWLLGTVVLLALLGTSGAQNAEFSFNSASNGSGGFATGTMLLDGDCNSTETGILRLAVNRTDPLLHSAQYLGCRAMYASPLQFHDSARGTAPSFTTSFTFRMTSLPGSYMGDGLAFVIAPSPWLPPNSLGGALGVYDTSAHQPNDTSIQVVAVAFDTVYNYVGLLVNGVVPVKAENLTAHGITLNDYGNPAPFAVWIDYDAAGKELLVYMGPGSESSPANKSASTLVLSYSGLDISSYVRNYSFVGFSAATGFYFQDNYVYNWHFRSHYDCPPGQ